MTSPQATLLFSSFVSTSVFSSEEWVETGLHCLCGGREGQGKLGVKKASCTVSRVGKGPLLDALSVPCTLSL